MISSNSQATSTCISCLGPVGAAALSFVQDFSCSGFAPSQLFLTSDLVSVRSALCWKNEILSRCLPWGRRQQSSTAPESGHQKSSYCLERHSASTCGEAVRNLNRHLDDRPEMLAKLREVGSCSIAHRTNSLLSRLRHGAGQRLWLCRCFVGYEHELQRHLKDGN
jgi:hypothetical protein